MLNNLTKKDKKKNKIRNNRNMLVPLETVVDFHIDTLQIGRLISYEMTMS